MVASLSCREEPLLFHSARRASRARTGDDDEDDDEAFRGRRPGVCGRFTDTHLMKRPVTHWRGYRQTSTLSHGCSIFDSPEVHARLTSCRWVKVPPINPLLFLSSGLHWNKNFMRKENSFELQSDFSQYDSLGKMGFFYAFIKYLMSWHTDELLNGLLVHRKTSALVWIHVAETWFCP